MIEGLHKEKVVGGDAKNAILFLLCKTSSNTYQVRLFKFVSNLYNISIT